MQSFDWLINNKLDPYGAWLLVIKERMQNDIFKDSLDYISD